MKRWSSAQMRLTFRRLLRNVTSRKRATLGVEVLSEYFKVAILEPDKENGGRIRSVHLLPLPPGDSERIEAISQFLDQDEFAICSTITLVIPKNLVSSKILTLPESDPSELGNIVRLQAERLSPFPPSDLVSDFSSISNQLNCRGSRITLFSTRKSHLLKSIEALGPSAHRVTNVFLATELVRDYVIKDEVAGQFMGSDVTVIVDVDFHITNIIMVQERALLYSRAVPFGVSHLKKDASVDSSSQWCEQIYREMDKTIAACAADQTGFTPLKIVFCGATIGATQLHDRAAKPAQKPTMLMPSASGRGGRNSESDGADSLTESHSFSSCAGLLVRSVTRRLDFLPLEIRRRRKAASTRRDLARTGLVVMVLVMLMALYLNLKLTQRQEYLELIQGQLNETSELAREVESKHRQVRLMEEQSGREEDVLEFLIELSRLSSPSVALEHFDYSRQSMVILKGRATNLNSVLSFVESLKESSILGTVGLDFANTPRQGTRFGTRFQISAKLRGGDR